MATSYHNSKLHVPFLAAGIMVNLKPAIQGFVTVYQVDIEALWQKLGLVDADLPVQDAITVLEVALEGLDLLTNEHTALKAVLKKLTKESGTAMR